MTLSGAITQAALRADFDQFTSRINTRMVAGAADYAVVARRNSLAAADDISLRSVAWTAPDDAELRVLRAEVTFTTNTRLVTARLYAENDPNFDYTGGAVVEVSRQSINGNIIGSLDLRATTGRRIMLIRGIRYRLEVLVDAASVDVGVATAFLRSRRRTR
jgi:hypothetical protein